MNFRLTIFALLQIKGIIFDSAPHHRTLRSTYHATAGLIGAPSLINVPLTFLATGMVAVYHDILWVKQRFLVISV